MIATAGQLLVNDKLPDELRDYNRVMDKDEASVVFSYLAKYHPRKYVEVADYLNRLGADAAYYEGVTVKLSDIAVPFDKKPFLAKLKLEEAEIKIDPSLTAEQKAKKMDRLYAKYGDKLEKLTYEKALAKDNSFANQVKSKARGSKAQLSSLLTTPSTYADSKGNTIPIFIERSLSEGLMPHEYWSSSYGGRLGIICLSGDTLVSTDLGDIPIKDLKKGDWVVSSNMLGSLRLSRVVEVHYNGKMPMFEWVFRDRETGTTVKRVGCTETHKFLVTNGLENLLVPISEIYSNTALRFVNNPKLDIHLEEYLGEEDAYDLEIEDEGHKYLLGNGLITENSSKFCIAGTETVEMYDGSIRMIEDIAEGDQIYTVDFDNLTKEVVEVTEVFYNGPKECFRYIFKDDRGTDFYIIATKAHRILICDQYNLTRMSRFEELECNGSSKVLLAREFEDEEIEKLNLVDIEYVGLIDTCDLQVDHFSHRYVLSNGMIVSNSTRQAGYLGKLLNAASIDQLVTEKDCETFNGMPVATSDSDNVGALLAIPTGDYGAGTELTKEVISDLGNNKIDEIVVRSPIACEATNGVCGYCAGKRETGDFPPLGYNIGLNASTPVSERIAQGSLNVKHCLHSGTMVSMGDGTNRPIRDIKVGEEVVGCDLNGKTKVVKVLNVFYNGLMECYRTTFKNKKTSASYKLNSTLDHNILATLKNETGVYKVGMSEGLSIKVGGMGRLQEATYKDRSYLGICSTVDIEIDHPDHLFVLANGLIVSNSGKKSSGNTEFSGFDVIKNFATIPKQFKHQATVSEMDGTVDDIQQAPQGGWFVTVGGNSHYLHPDLEVTVKKGDLVEAGDQLNMGIPSPADVTRLKGIGEGRRYFAEGLTKILKDSGIKSHRRNAEVLARAMIGHLQVDELDDSGNGLPGDILNYSGWASNYKPRDGYESRNPEKAANMYLEQPALNYTIGTRVTPSVIKRLKRHGVGEVDVYPKPPGNSPVMLGVAKIPEHTGDWVSRLGSSRLKDRLSEDIRLGSTSDIHGIHPLSGVAKGVEFGRPRKGEVTY